MRGKFIVLEGLDGAGLFTQAGMLATHLREEGFRVFLTKEPTNGIIGGLAKAALEKEISTSAKTLQLLFAADRAHHLAKEIEPALERGDTVVCDRYLFSALAYGFVSDVNYKLLRSINLSFRFPDVGIFLDVLPETSLSRVSGEVSNLQLFDNKSKVAKVRQAYTKIAREFHLKRIDGNGDINLVSSRINSIVDKVVKK